jgi:hemolysin activation/secretion protein
MRRIIAVAAGLCPAIALAQTNLPIDRGRLDRDQPVTDIKNKVAPVAEPALPAAATKVEAADEAATPIRSIRFQGTQVPRVVAAAVEAFVGRRPDKATLQQLVQAMTAAYGRSPIALFTILIPAQNLSSGDLIVAVGEGHVESVMLTGEVDGRSLKLVKAYADRLTGEKPTSRRTLERYLSLIRDIPGLKIDANLQMGRTPGGVRIILKLDYSKPIIAFSFDNRTTRLVKDGQVQGVARYFGGLRDGDLTELTVSSSIDFNDFLYAGISHSTPVGDDGMRLAASVGFLKTRPDNSVIEGEAKTFGLTMSYPIIRGYKRNLSLSAAIDGINSDNAALGSIIASEHTRAGRIALGYGQSTGKLSFSISAIGSQGIDILGAKVNRLTADTGFTKVNGRFALDRQIGKKAVLRLRASAQWTADPLPAAERFAVGGADFGRAFEVALLSADKGQAGLIELAFRPIGSGKFAPSEVYGFADMARVTYLSRGAFPKTSFDLGSAGGGIRLVHSDKARLELEAARPFDDPYASYHRAWRYSIGWKLMLRP